MAASLLRRARNTHVAHASAAALRAWASSALRHPEPRLIADRAELGAAHNSATRYSSSSAVSGYRDASRAGFSACTASQAPPQLAKREPIAFLLPHSVRGLASQSAPQLRQQVQEESKGLSKQAEEDPFDSLTDKIPERPVSVAEGASYSLVILAGLAVAGVAAYAVLKELIFEPKEYKIFGKALNRVQNDHQVMVRLGSPITGYGQESRNRAARQRISNRTFVDEDGVERVEVMFYIRGPQGAGKVYSEMFKDKEENDWKFTYLIVDITAPTPTRLMLESYMPALPVPVRA